MALDVVSFAKKNGFIWGPEPEIYGGMAGFYTYGPLGKLLKENIENRLRRIFKSNMFWEVETPIVVPKRVWDASGHLSGFNDPLIRDTKGNIFRVDKLIEESLIAKGVSPDDEKIGSLDKKGLLELIKKHKIISPSGYSLKHNIEDHNLMMSTTIGTSIEAFNRPETATVTYLPFKNYYDFFRKQLPFKVFQIGKAFRNEISPRQNVIRGREFTQAEAQIFLFEDQKRDFEEYDSIKSKELPFWSSKMQLGKKRWNSLAIESAVKKSVIKSRAYGWALAVAYELILELGIPENRIRIRQHHEDERAFYAEDAWDIEVQTNTYSWIEVAGVHDRKDYDLTQHQNASGEKLAVEGQIPHIIEIAFGVDRPVFALLDIFLEEEQLDVDKASRVIWRVPKDLAPIRFAVFPLQNKDGLPERAREVYDFLSERFNCIYDSSGSIGKRYRRQDERGTPYCVTIDYETLKDKTVTLRNRDTMEQKRIKIVDLKKSDVS